MARTSDSLEKFQKYFDIAFVNTPELLERVFRVRYDVYCQEFQYESQENCPGGLEQDEFDQYSLHSLVIHRASNLSAGCVRLIKPPVDNLFLKLPLEKYCSQSLIRGEKHPSQVPRSSIAEISRLAVHTQFRRRYRELESPLGRIHSVSEEEQVSFPLIAVALIAISTALMELTQRQDLFIMVEPKLAIRMRQLGLPFKQVGASIEYHGARAAYHVTTGEMLNGMRGILLELYNHVYNILKIKMN